MKTNLLKSIFISLILVMGVSNAWADNGDFYNTYLTYTFGATNGSAEDKDNGTGLSKDLGTLNSGSFKITAVYLKCWDDWQTGSKSGGGQMCYQKDGGATQYLQGFSRSNKSSGSNNYEWQNTNANLTIANSTDKSGSYTLTCWFQTWGDNWGDRFFPKSSGNYTFTYKIAPPAVKSFTVTRSGDVISGSGEQADPYIIRYNGSLTLTLSGSQNHTDANSTIQYNTAGTWDTTNSRTISNVNSTEVKNVTVKARYKNNSDANLCGTESSKTIYYRSEQVYTVTFNANGHGTAPTAQKISEGGKATQPTAPTATGYTFGGWYKEAGCTNAFDFNTVITADITLYAKWTIKNHKITYNAPTNGTYTIQVGDNAAVSANTTADYNTVITLANTPNKGYHFTGWTTTPNITITANKFNMPDNDVTISAGFEENTYTVTFNNNGGTGEMADMSFSYNESKALTANAFSKEGHTFNGWNTVANGSGTPYANGANVSQLTDIHEGKVTLYAQWKANTYTVVFDANGGEGTMDPQGFNYGVAQNLKANSFTRTGYTFVGWATAEDGEKAYDDKQSVNNLTLTDKATITLYAQWTIKQYTVTFGVCAESRHGAIQLGYGTKVTESATSEPIDHGTPVRFTATPESNDYKIEGWYSDANCANKIQAAGTNSEYTFTLTGETTVYVKFAEADEQMSNVYVSASSGGTVSQSGNVPVGNKTPSTFTATPNPGYRFDRWKVTGSVVAPQDLTTATISITANGSGTLTANFVRVHTVNFFATPAVAGTATATATVNGNANAITSGDKLDANTSITFTAAVANAYNGQCTFVRWVDGAGNPLSNNAEYTHTVKEDITVKAIFKIKQYTLTFSASEGGYVSATANNSAIASPATLDYNTSVTLTAEPDAGCAFVKWVNENGTQISTNPTYTFNLTAAKTAKAVFAQGTTVYMKAIEYWKKDHPRYAIYYWKNEGDGWYDMTNVDCNGDIYEGYVPAGYTNFKFVRLAPSTSNSFAEGVAWNETPDLITTNNAGKMYIQPHVYLKPNSNWKQSNARFAAYFYADGKDAKWFSMNDLDGDGIYSCEIPTGYTSVIFCRMNPAHTDNRWNTNEDTEETKRLWNQTSDLEVPTDKDDKILYTLTNSSWNAGSWGLGTGLHKNGWQDYAEPNYEITYNSKQTNGTITVTKAGNPIESGTSLTMGDEIKITFTPDGGYELINYNVEYATETGEEGVYTVCGPTKITAEFAKTGTARTVYLRPNEDWLKDEPIFAAYAWNFNNNTQNHWYIMTTKADDYTGAYSCNISSSYDWVTFVRIKPAGRDGSDGSLKFENAWNQTIDLQIINNTPRFAIGEERTVDEKQKYDGAWEKNTPIWGITANFNDWKAEKAVFKGYPGHLDEMPSFGTSHAFKLYNFFGVKDQSEYFGNAGTMKRANSGQWWTMDATDQANCQMMLDVKGDYIYQMRFLTVGAELRKQISVTYPAAEMYYIMYEETGEDDLVKQRISYGIRRTGEYRLDTVSFFVDVTKSAKIYILDGNQTKVGDPYTIIGTGGQNPGGAMAPQRRTEDNPELSIEKGCGITESGVHNFVAQQDGKGIKLLIDKWHAYTGAYYIRTDAASGGWGGYKQNGNKMTYTSYADKKHNFDHYYCKWITSSESSYANVKFCVANDYSHKLSDEWDGDEIIEKANVPTGCLPEDANVRFGWDSKTNELSRAYISGSAKAVDRFLVLTGNEYLLDIEGKAFPNGTGNREGLKANEEIFDDMGNWLYQLDVKANTQTAIKLTAQFNNRVQTFFGDARTAADGEELIDATTPEYHKVRMIYNFKTNHLLVAWLLDPQQPVNNENVASDVLIIRENHGDANQLQFKQGLNQMAVKTAYATMTFTKGHVTDTKKSQWQRYEYWVSFPFDVKISDVFGFGEYGTEWIMQLYDGASRAKNGLWVDSPTYWKYITNRNYTLKAGVGYVLKLQASKMNDENAFKYSDKVSLYFPSTPNADGNTIISATPDTQHEIPEHECTIPRDNRNIYDSHWNLIGVPGYANISDFNTAASLSPVNYDNQQVSFYYEYDAVNNAYQATSETSDFKNMHSYMVQFAGIINWSTKVAIKPAELAARRNSDVEPEKRTLRLEIAQGEEMADQTFVQLQQEGATREFDMNIDLTKIINSGANIYTLVGNDRIQTAGNALPMEEVVVPVGVQIAADGEYTFRMPEGTEGMVVELVDYETYNRTNLLLTDYTVTLPKGTSENRFALHIQPQKDVVTSLENIGEGVNNDEAVNKYLIDGKLIIRTAEGIFDAQGHRL